MPSELTGVVGGTIHLNKGGSMFEWLAVLLSVISVFVVGFLLGCYLTLHSIRQDGIDLSFDGNAWKIKERNEKNS